MERARVISFQGETLFMYLGHFNTVEQAEARYKAELAKYWEAQK